MGERSRTRCSWTSCASSMLPTRRGGRDEARFRFAGRIVFARSAMPNSATSFCSILKSPFFGSVSFPSFTPRLVKWFRRSCSLYAPSADVPASASRAASRLYTSIDTGPASQMVSTPSIAASERATSKTRASAARESCGCRRRHSALTACLACDCL